MSGEPNRLLVVAWLSLRGSLRAAGSPGSRLLRSPRPSS